MASGLPGILTPLVTRPCLDKQHAKNSIPPEVAETKLCSCYQGRCTMVSYHSMDIRKRLQSVSTGSLTTLDPIRQSLTQEHLVDTVCPMTTGLFIRLVAEPSRKEELETGVCPTLSWRHYSPKGNSTLNSLEDSPRKRFFCIKKGI